MKKEVIEWQNECNQFQEWFSNLGGNIGSDKQMSEAFRRIEAKGKTDNRLFDAIEQQWVNSIEVVEVEIL